MFVVAQTYASSFISDFLRCYSHVTYFAIDIEYLGASSMFSNGTNYYTASLGHLAIYMASKVCTATGKWSS